MSLDMLKLLAKKHKPPGWVFLTELRNATSLYATRSIDAYAIGLWAKMGLGVTIAYEIKTSRADFMNEIRDPEKRGTFQELASQFYFVVPKGLIRVDEVPSDSGLMEVTEKRATITKIAPARGIKSLPVEFVASLLGRGWGVKSIQHERLFEFIGRPMSHEDLLKYIADHSNSLLPAAKYELQKEMEIAHKEKIESQGRDAARVVSELFGYEITPHQIFHASNWYGWVKDVKDKLDQANKNGNSAIAINRMQDLLNIMRNEK